MSFLELLLLCYFFLALCGLSSIGPYCNEATISSFSSILFSLVSTSFLFFSDLLTLDLLIFIPLLSLVGLILALWDRAGILSPFRLIVQRIEALLQVLFSFETSLI